MSSSLVFTVNPTAKATNKENWFSCPLCCEDKPSSSICTLSKCSHESCHDCCVKWIQKAEASGQHTLPGCPWCRLEMSHEETMWFLGRPFSPATRNDPNSLREELDDLTQQWLDEHVRMCPSCGASIEKIPGGCDLMECICGFRFCYGCGSQGANCTCTPSHHYFWDNVLDRAAQRAAPPRAAIDENGTIDLLSHIRARIQKEKAEKTKQERRNRRIAQSNELYSLDIPTASAVWLYTSNKAGIRILNQIVRAQRIRTSRARRHYDTARDIQQANTELYGAKWLFGCKGTGSKWLNYITSGTVKLTQRARHRHKLSYQRECELYYSNPNCNQHKWLFCENTQKGFKILANQVSLQATSTRRLRMSRKNENTKFEGAALAIANGTWLYQRKKPAQSFQQLARLQQQRPRPRRSNNLFFVGTPNHRRMMERMELDNALRIRLLYLSSPEEQEEERAVMEKEQEQVLQQQVAAQQREYSKFSFGRSVEDPMLDWELAHWLQG